MYLSVPELGLVRETPLDGGSKIQFVSVSSIMGKNVLEKENLMEKHNAYGARVLHHI